MALPKKYNFNDYDNYITDTNPTTSAEAQDYFRNTDSLVGALVDTFLWQPNTTYVKGDVVKSNAMPSGVEAVCVNDTNGKSSNIEPEWGSVGGGNVSDGTCFWELRMQGTVTSVNGAKPNVNGEVTVPTMKGSTSSTNGASGLVPAPVATSNELFLSNEGEWKEAGKVKSVNGKTGDVVVDLPIGHMYFSVEPNVPVGRLPAFGATYNRSLYADLWNWANSVGLVKSESEWQSIASANGGNCAYYSSGDGSTTFRVPKMPTSLVTDASNGAVPVVGNGMALGFTDGTKFGGTYSGAYGDARSFAKVYQGNYGASVGSDNSGSSYLTNSKVIGVTSDPSKSGIVAKTSSTKITGQWLIVAFGVAHNIGEADVANVMQAVEQVQTGLREVESKMPSYKPNWNGYVQKTGTSFTAPSNGMVYLWNGKASKTYASELYVNSKQVGKHGVGNEGWTGQYGTLVAFVASGDVVSWSQSDDICYFVPFA